MAESRTRRLLIGIFTLAIGPFAAVSTHLLLNESSKIPFCFRRCRIHLACPANSSIWPDWDCFCFAARTASGTRNQRRHVTTASFDEAKIFSNQLDDTSLHRISFGFGLWDQTCTYSINSHWRVETLPTCVDPWAVSATTRHGRPSYQKKHIRTSEHKRGKIMYLDWKPIATQRRFLYSLHFYNIVLFYIYLLAMGAPQQPLCTPHPGPEISNKWKQWNPWLEFNTLTIAHGNLEHPHFKKKRQKHHLYTLSC